MRKPAVLVLGDCPQTLAVVRSMARAGYRVVVANESATTVAGYSRYCDARWRHSAGPAFADELANYLHHHDDICCLFPVGIKLIRRLYEAIELKAIVMTVVAVNPELLEACHCKSTANAMAAEAGINVPATCVVTSHAQLHRAIDQLGYPVIVKTVCGEARVWGRKAFVVADQQALERHFSSWPATHSRLMVQSYVAGTMLSCDFVAAEGRIVAYYETGVVRTDMPDGTGYVVEFRASTPTPALFDALKAFVSTHDYSGPGLLQCLLCAGTGKLYFLELNPRLSAGVAEVVAAGLDLPMIAVQAARQEPLSELSGSDDVRYQPGTTCYWFERDLMGWIKHCRHLSWSNNAAWLGHIRRCLLTNHNHINWQWNDPLPTAVILSRYAKSAIGRLRRVIQ